MPFRPVAPGLLLATLVGGVANGQADLGGAPAFGAGSLDKFGSAIAQVGDLDGDQVPDLFVGAPDAAGPAGAQSGAVHCRSGANPALQLGVFHGANGGERAGFALARIGDVDGDGVEDVVVGAPAYSGAAGANQGRVFVLSGATFTEIGSFTSGEGGARFGQVLVSVGDRDGDGIAEFLCGAPYADVAATDAGAVLLMKVTASGFTQLARFDGDEMGENLGLAATALPDVDGDGRMDFALASPSWDGPSGTNFGRVRLFSSDASSGFALLNQLTGKYSNDLFGWAVAPIGDPNGLSTPCLLVSCIGRNQAGYSFAGGASIFDPLNGNELLAAEGTNRNEFLGTSVASVGDVDRDGHDDFALGAPAFSPYGAYFGGCVDVYSAKPAVVGRATQLCRIAGTAGQRFGQFLMPAGDVDGDGLPDLLMGATGETDPATGIQTGALHVLLGQRPRATPDRTHYHDLDSLSLSVVGYANLATFAILGTALSGNRDFAIDFSSPWVLTTEPDTDGVGQVAITGTVPDLHGAATTLYVQMFMPYHAALLHRLLCSEVATIEIN